MPIKVVLQMPIKFSKMKLWYSEKPQLKVLKVSKFQKDFLVSSNSSKKRTNEFVFSTVRQKRRIRLFVFWRNRQLEKIVSTLSDL